MQVQRKELAVWLPNLLSVPKEVSLLDLFYETSLITTLNALNFSEFLFSLSNALILNIFCATFIEFGTSKKLTHGTTTLSQEQEDHDHIYIDGEKIKIKPHSLYPDRDAQNEPKKREDDDRSQSRAKRKCFYQDAPLFRFHLQSTIEFKF